MLIASDLYNNHIIDRHDFVSKMCMEWVEHYSFLLNLRSPDEPVYELFREEMKEYLCYDI
jgi:hypothetical protein